MIFWPNKSLSVGMLWSFFTQLTSLRWPIFLQRLPCRCCARCILYSLFASYCLHNSTSHKENKLQVQYVATHRTKQFGESHAHWIQLKSEGRVEWNTDWRQTPTDTRVQLPGRRASVIKHFCTKRTQKDRSPQSAVSCLDSGCGTRFERPLCHFCEQIFQRTFQLWLVKR